MSNTLHCEAILDIDKSAREKWKKRESKEMGEREGIKTRQA